MRPSKWRSLANKRAGVSKVGGIAIGTVGATGTIYDGYTLSTGDDFNDLSILAPANSRGRWLSTRSYFPGPRGSDTLLGTQYDTDPYFTGHNDSNRGVPSGIANMSQSGSVVNLQARKATAGEKLLMSSVRNEVASMLDSSGYMSFFPDAEGTGDILVEAYIKFTAKAGNPAGWHPTLWTTSKQPVNSGDSDELDWEGNSQGQFFHRNLYTGGAQSVFSAGVRYDDDGLYHLVTLRLNTTNAYVYIDGNTVPYASAAWNMNTKSKLQRLLLTNHIYNGTFESEAYSQAAWDADADGATMSVDYVRVWRRSAKTHYRPLLGIADRNVDYGSSLVFTLPSAIQAWGVSPTNEYLQVIPHEENEPGVTHSTTFTQFPPGVTYNTATRQVTVAITSGKTGRMNFALDAYEFGGTNESLRFAVNVGPNINLSALSYATNQVVSFDLYAVCDCGVLTSNGTLKTKTINVSGLSGSGLTYNDTTGILSGTAIAGTFPITITSTNSIGQVSGKSIAITIAAGTGYAYEAWTGPGWFDASDAASISVTGSVVTGITNKRTNGGNLTAGGTSGNLVVLSAAQNGKNAISVTRDVSTATSPPRLSSTTTSILSQAFQGTNKPYTVIIVYKPTDTNTGFVWAASNTTSTTDSQNIALVRRSAAASSIRRQVVTATSGDVSFGSGQAANSVRIVAASFTGSAVSVWDTSLTASVVGAAQSASAFSTSTIFRLFAAETNGPPPILAGVQASMQFYECVVEDTARSTTDIQTAISNMAAKWGVTLS
jgi:hypothetical protein